MKVRFISLASGSSGNCYYLGTDTYGILIDAGIGIRTIKKTLKDFNILMESINSFLYPSFWRYSIISWSVVLSFSSFISLPIYKVLGCFLHLEKASAFVGRTIIEFLFEFISRVVAPTPGICLFTMPCGILSM